ncbi:hypothetical protein SAMN04488498_1656 [Mesorhizobium albiziae]|uniref:Uncharacterized protein n=1 Tax=Neomesorhizobium albiziae TaxID=335020 RepID=A0A1I4FX86_9HYPH|nr:hypothetical protein SAMN04488498_1656 [Mesorhizobium albiziae]
MVDVRSHCVASPCGKAAWLPATDVMASRSCPSSRRPSGSPAASPIDDESLRAAIQAVLPATPMGELEKLTAPPV